MKPKLTWLLVPISAGAFIATWGGWAKLATMTGYTETEMIPGSGWTFNTGIVLPLTVEPFGALAMAMAFNPKLRRWARTIAGVMAVTTLAAAGVCQVVVHQLTVADKAVAPPEIVGVTSVLPVIALGLSGALAMLNGVRVGDDGTSHGTVRVGFLGRIGTALGDAAATRAERFAESTRAPQAVDPQLSRDELGSTQEVVPAVPSQPSQPAMESARDDVPAAQGVGTAEKRDEAELTRDVARLRGSTNPVTGRQWSYQQIAAELGISKSRAQRLGTAPTKAPGTVVPTQAVFGTTQDDPTGSRVNGNVPHLEAVSR